MRYKYLTIILFTLVFISCGTTKEVEVFTEDEVKIPEEDASKIVFLYFDIEKTSGNNESINLTETQLVDGKLKENTILNAPMKEGNLILQILDDKKRVLEEQIIENPLNQNIEQYNQSGVTSSQKVEQAESQFYMRFNYKKEMKTVKILKIKASENIEISSHPINL